MISLVPAVHEQGILGAFLTRAFLVESSHLGSKALKMVVVVRSHL